MAQSIVQPEALYNFAKSLKSGTKKMEEMTNSLETEMNQLEEYWQDARFKEFMGVYKLAMKDIHVFLHDAQKQVSYLEKKAEFGARYLRR